MRYNNLRKVQKNENETNHCIADCACLALALTACGETKPTDDVQQGGAAVEKKITIGCCVMDLSNEVFVQYAEGYNQFLKDTKGTVEINLVDGGGNVATQVQAIEDFISMGVDGIMLNALDTSAVEDVIQKAMDAAIKVGVYPSMENVTFNFVFDEYDWGYTEGEEAAKWIDEKLGGSATIMSFAPGGELCRYGALSGHR